MKDMRSYDVLVPVAFGPPVFCFLGLARAATATGGTSAFFCLRLSNDFLDFEALGPLNATRAVEAENMKYGNNKRDSKRKQSSVTHALLLALKAQARPHRLR